MGDFIEEQGKAFLAHLLGRLHDHLVRGFADWNVKMGILAPPRTHSTMRLLSERGPKSVTEIATALKQSHPLIITWVRTLRSLGFIETEGDPQDGRRTLISLTTEWRRELERQRRAEPVTVAAIERLIEETGTDLFAALQRMERACNKVSFADRLLQEGGRTTRSGPDG